MDAYELPEEFAHLQAQDMSRLGFMQDLVRGIKKLTAAPKPKAAPAPAPVAVAENLSAPNVAVLLRRVAILLEDGEFENADDLCDQILNREPENGEAYFYRLLAELGAKTPQDLVEHHTDFAKNTNFQRALRFGDEALKQKLNQYVDESKALRQRKEDEALEWKLNKALQSVLQNNHPNGALNEAKELLMRLKQWSFK